MDNHSLMLQTTFEIKLCKLVQQVKCSSPLAGQLNLSSVDTISCPTGNVNKYYHHQPLNLLSKPQFNFISYCILLM